ncbi:27673_t:CDS:2, partial [Dentiscutata erythropus]
MAQHNDATQNPPKSMTAQHNDAPQNSPKSTTAQHQRRLAPATKTLQMMTSITMPSYLKKRVCNDAPQSLPKSMTAPHQQRLALAMKTPQTTTPAKCYQRCITKPTEIDDGTIPAKTSS